MFRITRTPRIIRMIFSRMTWGFSLDKPAVFLTFDDGPDPELTNWVLDTLKEHDAKATFFCVGDNVRKHPETFSRIISEGHSVGNHTMSHEKGWLTTDEVYMRSIQEASELIDSRLFRPPYGKMKRSQVSKVTKAGYRIIMWTWLTYDFDKNQTAGKICQEATRLRAGDVIVLHDNPKCGERLRHVLPVILTEAQKKGLTFQAIH